MSSKITEKTLIPISLVITLVGGVAWLSNLHFVSAQSAEAITKIEQKQDSYVQSLDQIKLKLIEIEANQKHVIKKLEELSERRK